MSLNEFAWTDLSTFDLKRARSDYSELFDWRFAGNRSYDFALLGEMPVAAIFPMPKRLQKINMPSFWMSYVRVEDLNHKVEIARSHEGAIIEVEPERFSDTATVALVRDPSGAGFTLYEGPPIAPVHWQQSHGMVVARYHHLPDIGLIATFYRDLFDWRFEPLRTNPWPTYNIRDEVGVLIATAEEVPEEVRGKYRYWMPCFGVGSAEQTLKRLEKRGGAISFDLQDGRLILADKQGAHFMISPLR